MAGFLVSGGVGWQVLGLVGCEFRFFGLWVAWCLLGGFGGFGLGFLGLVVGLVVSGVLGLGFAIALGWFSSVLVAWAVSAGFWVLGCLCRFVCSGFLRWILVCALLCFVRIALVSCDFVSRVGLI